MLKKSGCSPWWFSNNNGVIYIGTCTSVIDVCHLAYLGHKQYSPLYLHCECDTVRLSTKRCSFSLAELYGNWWSTPASDKAIQTRLCGYDFFFTGPSQPTWTCICTATQSRPVNALSLSFNNASLFLISFLCPRWAPMYLLLHIFNMPGHLTWHIV